jgi:hypothetical protein
MIEIIEKDLLLCDAKYIAHQTNCVSNKSAFLAYDLFKKYPYSDVYSNRTIPDSPGTIKIFGDGIKERFVINMFSQYYPGKSKYPESEIDGLKAREKYFHKCLNKIAKIKDLESIAFPYFIGCGAAGGDWNYYYNTLINFENYIKQYNTKVFLCKYKKE